MVKQPKLPPIFVYGVTDYMKLANFLVEKQVEDCKHKETSRQFILTTTTVDHYDKLHSILCAECADSTHAGDFGVI